MEKITFRNLRGQTLVGNFYPASTHPQMQSTTPHPTTPLVIFAHGLISDKESQGKFEIYANKLVEVGISALTFDFSGCGESDDETISIEKEMHDLRAVILDMRAKGYRNLGLYGHSLGSLICLKVYSPDIAPDILTMALSGAFTGPVHFKWEEIFNSDQMQELLETGKITTHAHSLHRNQVIIEGQTLNDLALLNQKLLLQNIKCPLLIIHGDGDNDERTLYEVSQGGMQYLSPTSEIRLISGATHNFDDHVEEVAMLLQTWFLKYLGSPPRIE